MARATKAEKARLLNAAYRLLGQQMERAEAARHLGREFALSRRQAYRYLQKAAGLSDRYRRSSRPSRSPSSCRSAPYAQSAHTPDAADSPSAKSSPGR